MNESGQARWHILLVDDDEDDYLLTRNMLRQAQGRQVTLDWAPAYPEGRLRLQADHYDAVLVDYDLGPQTGIDFIREAVAMEYPAPLILYTGRGNYEVDVEAMQAGATLYLAKSDANPLLLERFIRYAIERKRMEQERKPAEQALHEKEASLQGILDATRESIWLFDLAGIIRLGNQTALARLKKPAGEVIGRHFSQFMPPELAQARQERLTQVIETGQPIEFEDQRAGIAFLHNFYPVRDAAGKVTGVAAFSRDITHRNQTEHELQTAHRQTAEILESISDAFYSLDQESRFTYVNHKAAALWGMQPQDLLGKIIWDVFPSGRQTESYARIHQALAHRQPVQYESYSAFLDQWVDIHIYPTEQGVSVYFQDITARKQAEAALTQYTRDLERSNRDLQEFAFVASHDLQEPLRKIELLGRLILDEGTNLTERQKDQFTRMRTAAARMLSMIDGLLQLSRLSTQARSFQAVDLNHVVHEVLSDLEVLIKRTGGTVEVGNLPCLKADPLQMHQLMQNLIGNALKFQPPGRVPLVKIYSQRLTPTAVQILVEDNGIGFDEKHLAQLFQPFKRLVGKSEYEGSGIGLAIARRIVERHGGDITARSQRGQGTTFLITLPVDPPAAD